MVKAMSAVEVSQVVENPPLPQVGPGKGGIFLCPLAVAAARFDPLPEPVLRLGKAEQQGGIIRIFLDGALEMLERPLVDLNRLLNVPPLLERLAQAREVADRFRDEELAKARQEISAERARAEADIQRERDSAIEELRREFSGLAIKAAESVVSRSLDESVHRELIEQVLEEGSKFGTN